MKRKTGSFFVNLERLIGTGLQFWQALKQTVIFLFFIFVISVQFTFVCFNFSFIFYCVGDERIMI